MREARDFLVQVSNADGAADGAAFGAADSVDASGNNDGGSNVLDIHRNNEEPSSAVEKIALQVDQVAKSTSVMNISNIHCNVAFGGAVVSTTTTTTNSTATSTSLAPPGILPPPGLTQMNTGLGNSNSSGRDALPQSVLSNNSSKASASILPAATNIMTPLEKDDTKEQQQQTQAVTSKIKIRRTQTRLSEQPGKLFANGVAADPTINNNTTNMNSNNNLNNSPNRGTLTVHLRTELTARWILPLKHLRERVLRLEKEQQGDNDNNTTSSASPAQNLTIRDALQHLAIGLYRHGVADNGSHCSIVSKEILSTNTTHDSSSSNNNNNNNNGKDYPYDVDTTTDCIFGTVPFYSPRTPGNVLFRLYFENEPHITLATGPIVRVIPPPDDYSSVLRFILSNFKSGKTNGMSALHSFGTVLEGFTFTPHHNNSRGMEEAGRAAWGCICETRKLVETASKTFVKKRGELEEMERELEEAEKVKKELLVMAQGDVVVKEKEEGEEKKGVVSEERSRLMGEKYTNERKWKEMQLAYATLLEVSLMEFISSYTSHMDIC